MRPDALAPAGRGSRRGTGAGRAHGGAGFAGAEPAAFIGRDRELAVLRRLAATSRALTLCGPGGIGKTRLALRLMADLSGQFPDGAFLVDLAGLRQGDLVASRVAAALGIVEEPGRPLLATLADALRPRRLLLCLDTCEHLIDACARACQRLLAAAPGLRVLATSREPLRVAAETAWQVPPMSLPPMSLPPASPAGRRPGWAGSDAMRLFAARAAAADPGFSPGPGNFAPAAAICRALDGLPLAIELAAARVGGLSCEQIAARLASRPGLLASPGPAGPAASPRHRTLRAAIDWSHDLLTPPERILLRRLAVFAGWTLEEAEQVCAGPGGAGALAAGDILDLLTALADKSLVVAEPQPGGIRYRMLDTIREYAAERLAAAGEAAAVHARLRDYAVREVERAALVGMAQEPGPWSARVASFRRYEAESGNLRQVLGRCLADGDAEAGLRLCAAMRPVWIVHGSFAEGAGWIDAFLRAAGARPPDGVLGAALVSRAQLALATDPAAARGHALAGLRLCRAAGSAFWAGSALNLLAEAELHAGRLADADARAREALALARRSGDRWNEGYALGTRAAAAGHRGDLAQARSLGEAALAVMREIDQQWGAARALLGLGDLARLTGDAPLARRRYEEALGILREVGATPEIARCLAGLGRLAVAEGDHGQAGRHLAESLELSRSVGSRIGVIRAAEAFAALARARGDARSALLLAGACAALRREAGLPPPRGAHGGRSRQETGGLPPAQAAGLRARGEALGAEGAIALALSLAAGGRPGGLTPRELEVAALVARGHTNRAIAAELGISPATAARHVSHVMGRLGAASRAQVAAWAARHGY